MPRPVSSIPLAAVGRPCRAWARNEGVRSKTLDDFEEPVRSIERYREKVIRTERGTDEIDFLDGLSGVRSDRNS